MAIPQNDLPNRQRKNVFHQQLRDSAIIFQMKENIYFSYSNILLNTLMTFNAMKLN